MSSASGKSSEISSKNIDKRSASNQLTSDPDWCDKPKTKRNYGRQSKHRYVRAVRQIGSYQARIPIGPTKTDSINLGVYSVDVYRSATAAEAAAGRAAREFVRRYKPHEPGRTPWAVIVELQKEGIVPARVLPRWVELRPSGYAAYCKCNGCEIDLPGFATAEAAHKAMVVELVAIGREVVSWV